MSRHAPTGIRSFKGIEDGIEEALRKAGTSEQESVSQPASYGQY
jgi:hypothetical protein